MGLGWIATSLKIETKWQETWAHESLSVPNPGASPVLPDRLEDLRPRGCFRTRRASCTWATSNYMLGEVVAHFRRRMGYATMPMGFDSFGLPPRTQPSRPPPAEMTERASPRSVARWSAWAGHRLGPDLRDARPRVLPLDAVALPALLRPRPCLPQAHAQVVPERPDRPRERAGDRRALRALRRGGRGPEPRAVVLGSRPMRTPCWTRWRCSSRGRSASSPMQRNWIGREGAELVFRVGARPRDPGLHHAAGHDLRRHLLRLASTR